MDTENGTDGTMSQARLARFEEEVGRLKVTGGAANPERLGGAWGVGLIIVGFVISFIAWWSAYNAGNFESIHRSAIFALIGVGGDLHAFLEDATQHDFRIHKVLGAAEGDEAYFDGHRGIWSRESEESNPRRVRG